MKTSFLNELQFVGTLFYEEYPTTVLFKGPDGNPWIEEWIDVDEEDISSYLLYKILPFNLKKFIDGEISHLNMIQQSRVFFYKGSIEDSIDFRPVESLPYESLPADHIFFDKDYAVDLDLIIQTFSLNNILDEELEVLKHRAKINNRPLINLHIHQGSNVGYGNIETNTLGAFLLRFNALSREVYLDFVYGKDRSGKNKLTEGEKSIISTNVVKCEAASFSIFMEPRDYMYTMEQNTFDSTLCDTLELTDISDHDAFEAMKTEKSKFVLAALKLFSEEVVRAGSKVDLNFYSPSDEEIHVKNLTCEKSNKLVQFLDEYSFESDEDLRFTGHFISINLKSRRYIFLDVNDNEYPGLFDKTLGDLKDELDFTSLYSVIINRKTKNVNNKITLIDTMTSFDVHTTE